MDLSMLPNPVSEYDKQRTGARFTVRSANSPSYSLTRRPGVRKPRGFSEEKRESDDNVGEREGYGTHAGTNGAKREEDRTAAGYQTRTGSVRGQREEEEASVHQKLNQNGTDRSGSFKPASESRGRTDWRRYEPTSRSKSLDWRAGAPSPDRAKMADMLSTRRGLDERRTGLSGRVMSSIHAYSSAGTSHIRDPVSEMSRTLDRTSRGHSLPVRLRSLSGPGSGVMGAASSLGPKGGQSIMERIEKLYGSAGFGKTEDFTKSRDFSTFKYDRASGGTFPRRLSSGERSSLSPVQSRLSFTWTQRDAPGSNALLSPGSTRTRQRLSGVQWQEQIQGRYSEEGGVSWGTQSLDRVRSRYSVAAQIRSARAAAGITSPLLSNTFSGGERSASLRDLSVLGERRVCGNKDQGGVKGETNGTNETLRAGAVWPEEQEREADDGAKGKTELKSSSTDEDVFESNPQKITVKTTERKKVPERLSTPSAVSVRNKISQFEALSQRAQGLATGQVLMPRRAFSVPTQLSSAYDGVRKSGSAKAIGGSRYKVLKEGEEEGCEAEEKATGAGKKLGSNRSLSVDEVGLRLGQKEREGNDLNENAGKDGSDKALGGVEKQRGRFYIDETDFCKFPSPEEESKTPASSLLSGNSDTSAVVQKTSPPTSPVSDDDKTPTNSPKDSPALSPTTRLESSTPFADMGNKSSSILVERTKTPERDSPPLLHPLASSSHSNLPDLISPDVRSAQANGKKQVLDLEAWVAGLNPTIKVWNDEDDYEDDDDDESTQRDEDSNYDSDSGESSVTITSNMSQSDHKSFCVSLSDLCNFAGVDYESENDSDEWQSTSHRTASLSSDMSALSYVSVMPSEELDRLLEDVRSVGDSTLQDYNDVQVVVLHKDMGVGLGFSLAGGVDQNKPVTVHKVFHSGVAAQEGSIREGDQVLSINGTALSGYAHWEALRVLRRAKTREMGVVVLRRGGVSSDRKKGAQTNVQGPTQTQVTDTGQQLCVRLEKNSRDLGFSLEGGVDSNLGNRPLTVQKIFQGGPVDKVFPGDELEEIEGISVVAMRRLEAWTLIRRLPPGPVDVVLRRPLKHLET